MQQIVSFPAMTEIQWKTVMIAMISKAKNENIIVYYV